MYLSDDNVNFEGFEIKYADFPKLILAHLKKVQNTEVLEIAGRRLRSSMEAAPLMNFISEVCKWGGYAGIAGRIKKYNSQDRIVTHFEQAVSRVNSGEGLAAVMASINQLSGLGTPSFSSKHLRMLFPEQCGVLDALVHKTLKIYQFDSAGFEAYCTDLVLLGDKLNSLAISNPRQSETVSERKTGTTWWPGDCDMAIFSRIQNWA